MPNDLRPADQSLWDAIDAGDLEGVIKSIEALGADVNARNELGYTSLHHAVSSSLEIVGYLLDKGADVTAVDSENQDTVLHTAVLRNASLAMIRCLLEKGANPNQQDKHGLTPLHHYSFFMPGKKDTREILALFIEKRINLNTKNINGDTVLHIAAEVVRDPIILQYLIAAGADQTQQDSIGRTSLDILKERWDLNKQEKESLMQAKEDLLKKQQFMTFSLGKHPRVGKDSLVQALPEDIMGVIHQLLLEYNVGNQSTDKPGATDPGKSKPTNKP